MHDLAAAGPLLTPAEVCTLINVHPNTLYRWARAGKIVPALRTPGGHRRYTFAQIATLQAQRR